MTTLVHFFSCREGAVASNPPPPAEPPEQSSAARPGRAHDGGQQGSRVYPQQTLLPQQVEHRRSRTPIYVGLAVALVVVAGFFAWRSFASGGESTRAAYCSALKRVTHNGDLQGALSTANLRTLDQLLKLERLAPSAVRDDWTRLQSLATSAQSGSPNVSTAIEALTALQSIADDARHHCGIPMKIPISP